MTLHAKPAPGAQFGEASMVQRFEFAHTFRPDLRIRMRIGLAYNAFDNAVKPFLVP